MFHGVQFHLVGKGSLAGKQAFPLQIAVYHDDCSSIVVQIQAVALRNRPVADQGQASSSPELAVVAPLRLKPTTLASTFWLAISVA